MDASAIGQVESFRPMAGLGPELEIVIVSRTPTVSLSGPHDPSVQMAYTSLARGGPDRGEIQWRHKTQRQIPRDITERND